MSINNLNYSSPHLYLISHRDTTFSNINPIISFFQWINHYTTANRIIDNAAGKKCHFKQSLSSINPPIYLHVSNLSITPMTIDHMQNAPRIKPHLINMIKLHERSTILSSLYQTQIALFPCLKFIHHTFHHVQFFSQILSSH
jgi:hypothetical protein